MNAYALNEKLENLNPATVPAPADTPSLRIVDKDVTRTNDGLIEIVEEAVAGVEWPQKDLDFGLTKDCTYPTTKLITLEVYCYARGIYDSEKVSRFSRKDPTISPLFSYPWPEPLLIKRFRRHNREAIKQCLFKIFQLALLARFGDPRHEEAPIDSCVAQAIDQWFAPICGPQPEKEAEERIDQAIFWDGMASSS